MHTIYEKLWLISSELNHLTKVNKKSLYMAIMLYFGYLWQQYFCVVLKFCVKYLICHYCKLLRSCYTGIFRAVMYIYRDTHT